MIKILTLMNDLMNEMNLPYTFDKWDVDLILPHWVGEISENPNLNEDGKSEYSFILTGFARDYTYLFDVANEFKKRFATGEIIGNAVVMYERTIVVPISTDGVKQIQINLTINDWGVE